MPCRQSEAGSCLLGSPGLASAYSLGNKLETRSLSRRCHSCNSDDQWSFYGVGRDFEPNGYVGDSEVEKSRHLLKSRRVGIPANARASAPTGVVGMCTPHLRTRSTDTPKSRASAPPAVRVCDGLARPGCAAEPRSGRQYLPWCCRAPATGGRCPPRRTGAESVVRSDGRHARRSPPG